jgi:hypothetical protein
METEMINENRSKGLTLVIGGTGKTGRRVADRLVKAGQPVRIGSRGAEPPFDWEKPDSWGQALQGVKAVYVAYQPDLAVPGALETVRAFFAQAVESGVEKLVLLSGRGEVEAEQAEQALQATGVDWTILRSSWFCQNFSEGFFLDSILSGEVALPVGAVAEPFVDVDDIADIAFAALTRSTPRAPALRDHGSKSLNFRRSYQRDCRRDGTGDYVPLGFSRGLPCGACPARGAEGLHRTGPVFVHHRTGRTEHTPSQWRAACARQTAVRLL